ncbi:MAG: universal stress protein [Deltaproteobacteria bacterium]|nr:universal stress protein [Deltaproteobacteria bacterium]
MFTNIIVPVDFSKSSIRTAKQAVTLAQKYDAALHLIHVIEPSETIPYPIHIELESYREQAHTSATEKMQALVTELAYTNCKNTIAYGIPHTEINTYAKQHHIDLIMVAPHGKSGVERFFVGSVTDRLVRTSDCSILLVK